MCVVCVCCVCMCVLCVYVSCWLCVCILWMYVLCVYVVRECVMTVCFVCVCVCVCYMRACCECMCWASVFCGVVCAYMYVWLYILVTTSFFFINTYVRVCSVKCICVCVAYMCVCWVVRIYVCGGCPRGVMVKAMDCGVIVSEFVLQSRYYVHFRANTLGKVTNPFILPAMG